MSSTHNLTIIANTIKANAIRIIRFVSILLLLLFLNFWCKDITKNPYPQEHRQMVGWFQTNGRVFVRDNYTYYRYKII